MIQRRMTFDRMTAAEFRALKPRLKGRCGRRARYVKGHMNGDEARYARRLVMLAAAGEIDGWEFEPKPFQLAPHTIYTTDFRIFYPDGSQEYVEIKGFLKDDASLKFKWARQRFPNYKWTMLRWRKGQWRRMRI